MAYLRHLAHTRTLNKQEQQKQKGGRAILMRTEQIKYSIYRSRNNGNFWGLISYGMDLDLEEAQSFFEKEQKEHPSDWLRIVQEKSSVVDEYFGNSKKNPTTTTRANYRREV